MAGCSQERGDQRAGKKKYSSSIRRERDIFVTREEFKAKKSLQTNLVTSSKI